VAAQVVVGDKEMTQHQTVGPEPPAKEEMVEMVLMMYWLVAAVGVAAPIRRVAMLLLLLRVAQVEPELLLA
jgi:hypothetical protein